MNSFSELREILETYEVKRFDDLTERLTSHREELASVVQGQSQFVTLKPVLSNRADYEPHVKRRVALLLGINYDQNAEEREKNPEEQERFFVRYLGDSILENPEAAPERDYVRIGIERSLRAFERNEDAWKTATLWRRKRLPIIASPDAVSLRDYLIIVTNLYPLITWKKWTDEISAPALIKKVWDPEWHLGPLFEKLRGRVDLFIGHGKDEVWDEFDKWSERLETPWLKIYNCGANFNRTVSPLEREGHPWFRLSPPNQAQARRSCLFNAGPRRPRPVFRAAQNIRQEYLELRQRY